ncbi:MAG: MFS transporter [Acidobacteria bacterium]|nr:MFS transporter [Acidobacteriota bacterium]
MVAQVDNHTSRLAGMFQALRHRNFRLFWAGAFLSNAGSWMQTVAQAILVYNLTNSPFWLGMDTFMATAPGLLLTLFGGALADTMNRKRLLIYTQAGAGLSALTLAVFVSAGVVKNSGDVWIVLVLSFFTGCCWAISGPSYQAMAIDLVERRDLANAIALNSTQFQLARVIGPTLAALTISLFGLQGCFFANGFSYVAIVAAIALVRFEPKAREDAGAEAADLETQTLPSRTRGALWRDLLAGFRYVGGRPRVRLLLLCSAFVALFGAPYLVLAPVFAKQVFGWGDAGVSLLMGTAGAGALCGALLLAYLGDFKRKGKFVLGSAFSASVCLVGYSQAGHPAVALPLLFGIGFSMVSFFAVCNTLLQQLVTDEMRGRVMSMWILTFIGTLPVGSFLAGVAAEHYGAQPTLASGGVIIALFVLFIGFRNARLREI